MQKVIRNFDKVAGYYDNAASMQEYVATDLAKRASSYHGHVVDILDIGSGTGLASTAIMQYYPHASLTAFDQAPLMLHAAQRKLPYLKTIVGNAENLSLPQKFDIIISSMMLHWVAQPLATLRIWQKHLKPNGRMYIALLVEESFQEWRDLCHRHDVEDGLWPMPPSVFADEVIVTKTQQALTLSYSSVQEFLLRLKNTGAATPRVDYRPMPITIMRKILQHAPRPFAVSYQVLYVEVGSTKIC